MWEHFTTLGVADARDIGILILILSTAIGDARDGSIVTGLLQFLIFVAMAINVWCRWPSWPLRDTSPNNH